MGKRQAGAGTASHRVGTLGAGPCVWERPAKAPLPTCQMGTLRAHSSGCEDAGAWLLCFWAQRDLLAGTGTLMHRVARRTKPRGGWGWKKSRAGWEGLWGAWDQVYLGCSPLLLAFGEPLSTAAVPASGTGDCLPVLHLSHPSPWHRHGDPRKSRPGSCDVGKAHQGEGRPDRAVGQQGGAGPQKDSDSGAVAAHLPPHQDEGIPEGAGPG